VLEACLLFQRKGLSFDFLMILGVFKEDVRFKDEGFAYTVELTCFA